MKNFWNNLEKPILVLAPLADVTDAAFRRVIAKYGKPSVLWTEFVSADGLARAPEEGRKKLLKDLEYTEAERPIVAQFFTSHPEYMFTAAKLAEELGFDGIDINMGCPDKGVVRQGAGACLIKTPALARELIRAAKDGAPRLPVSVKTRVGFNKVELEEWLPELLAESPALITIHARTMKEMSKVPAQWELVKRAVEIRNASGKNTLIFGNGDVRDLGEARQKVEETGCDGVMLGRAIFGNPWLFAKTIPTLEEKLRVCVEHTKLFEELLGEYKNFSIMKKHFKAYINGFEGAAELRGRLMETNNAEEVKGIVADFLQSLE
ncbi:tRNA-dihydrouridine synthase [Candidatus Parcubacteria bacterium]|nr:tRNA-dihydrouridine synthase [Candidatus Parcubacteria bacterium]